MINSIYLLGTICVSVLSLVISVMNYCNLRANRFIEQITAERLKAYREMREYISLFIARNNYLYELSIKTNTSENEIYDVIKEIEALKVSIKMRLTLKNPDDHDLYSMLNYFPVKLSSDFALKKNQFDENLESIMIKSKDMLSSEWGRIKDEAQLGRIDTVQAKDNKTTFKKIKKSIF